MFDRNVCIKKNGSNEYFLEMRKYISKKIEKKRKYGLIFLFKERIIKKIEIIIITIFVFAFFSQIVNNLNG